MKPRLSVRLCSMRGVPVYLNVTLPLGLALASQFAFRPLAWLELLVVLLVHEAGHIALLWWYRLPVLHVLLHGFAGEVETAEWITPWQRAVVAWGGVLAQLLLAIVLGAGVKMGPRPLPAAVEELYFNLAAINLLSIAGNLIPIQPLDGRQAWRLPWLAILRIRRRWLAWQLRRTRATAERERLH